MAPGNAPAWLLVFDFGGTKHTAALKILPSQDSSWDQLKRSGWNEFARLPSPAGADAGYDLSTMIRLGDELLAKSQAHDLDPRQPGAIGVSFGGPVDSASGRVRLSHHVPGWENIRLADILADHYHVPVWVDNDANIAALGEYYFGAGRACHNLFYITVSTGVGGGWILDGRLWRGAEGMAGEIGHTIADPNGPICLCGKRGCVERLASGAYLAGDARQEIGSALAPLGREKLPINNGGRLLELAGGQAQNITAAHLSRAAADGDQLALSLIKRAAWALGVGIGNAANLVNPQRFILGGGVTKSGQIFWDGIHQAARQTALPEINIEIVPAALGDDAPLWGALAFGLEQYKSQ